MRLHSPAPVGLLWVPYVVGSRQVCPLRARRAARSAQARAGLVPVVLPARSREARRKGVGLCTVDRCWLLAAQQRGRSLEPRASSTKSTRLVTWCQSACVAFVTTGLGAISNDCPGRKDSRRGVAVGNLTGPWLEVRGRELGGDGSPEPARKLELELQTARAWPLSAPFGVPAAGGQPCRPRTSVGSWRFGTKQSFVDGSGVGKAKTISSQCRMPCGEQQRLRTRA